MMEPTDRTQAVQYTNVRHRQHLTAIVRGVGRVKIYMGADDQLWRWVYYKEFRTTLDDSIDGVGQHTVASTPGDVKKFLEVYTKPSTLRDRWIANAAVRVRVRAQ